MYQRFKHIEYLLPSPLIPPDSTRGLTENSWSIYQFPNASIPPGDDIETISNLFSAAFGYPVSSNISYNDPAASLGVFPNFDMLYDHQFINRWSSQKAFLNSSTVDQITLTGLYPRNLRVLPKSTVLHILFHPVHTTKAVGVSYLDASGVTRRAFATQNVVLSAHFYDAMILQRSGVGPASVLAEAGIAPRVINEHVGRNWNYHPLFQVAFLDFSMTGTNSLIPGWLAGIVNTFVEDPVLQTAPGQRGFQQITLSFPAILAANIWQLQGRSKGNITVYSDDPFKEGKMCANFMSDPDDLLSMRTELRTFVSSIYAADPSIIFLSIDNATLYDDNLLDEWILLNVLYFGGTYHNFGSCRMAPDSSLGAIDSDFKVFGATNLRVCDTQSLPIKTNGNPSYAVAALGQACAESILGIPPPSAKKNAAKRHAKTHPVPTKRITNTQQKRATPAEQYAAIVNYFNILKQKMPANANQIISGIMQTQFWKSLEAQFGPYAG
jgi:choline dehydrogenase